MFLNDQQFEFSVRFYLSSYKLGNETEKLKQLAGDRRIGFIPTALDYVDSEPRRQSNEKNMQDLVEIGIEVEMLDLKDYFGRKAELERKLSSLGGVWVRGGNTFVLRQAMRLSGFDDLIKRVDSEDFLYGGYSAGMCVLAPDLKALRQVDDPTRTPYDKSKEVIWEGLGILDYIILPHFKSDHAESADIDKAVEFCKENNVPFKTLRDGEVIILE